MTMLTELCGLSDEEAQELVFTYWASIQKHKALFSTKEKAEDACKYNPQRGAKMDGGDNNA